MSIKFLSLSALSVGLLSGCMSMSSMQTAKVLEDGKSEMSIEAGYFDTKSFDEDLDASLSLPYFGVSYRRGFGSDFDLGVKYIAPGTISADGKYQFVKGGDFALATGLGISYFSIESSSGDAKSESTVIDAAIPLYVSYDVKDWLSLYVVPKYVARMLSSNNSGFSDKDDNGSKSSTEGLVGASLGTKIGKEAGVYLETTYMTNLSTNTPFLQVGGSIFW